MDTMNLRSFVWFATGVVLTITSTATFGAWRVDAAPTPGESTYVPVTPCRLLDTRPEGNVPGSDARPITTRQSRPQQVTGRVGNCNIPTGASGAATNVTIVNPTASSYLALYPANETVLPVGSNLNWVSGQAPTPNKVDVKLSPDGRVNIYNNSGTVDVIIDVVGYYQTSTVTDLESRLAAAEAKLLAQAGAQTAQGAELVRQGNDIRATSNAIIAANDAIDENADAIGANANDTQRNADDLDALANDVEALVIGQGVIPSGTTVIGNEYFSGDIAFLPFLVDQVTLPGNAKPGAVLAFGFGAPMNPPAPQCSGSIDIPMADPGYLCIYPDVVTNVDEISIESNFVQPLRRFYVYVYPDNTGPSVTTVELSFSWAYTAP